MNADTCPKCRHANHDGYRCLNMASDNDCACTSPAGLRPYVSSLPADDVREALDADVTAPWPNPMHQVWERLVEFSEAFRRERGYSPNEAARTRFLFAAFDVRLRRTVTDAVQRAAVHNAIRRGIEAAQGGPADRDVVRAAADQVLALDSEVRPYGTVTDTEVRAAYEAFVAGPVDAHTSMRAALEAAREARS